MWNDNTHLGLCWVVWGELLIDYSRSIFSSLFAKLFCKIVIESKMFFLKIMYLFERERRVSEHIMRWGEQQRGRSRFPPEQGARHGAPSQDLGIMT